MAVHKVSFLACLLVLGMFLLVDAKACSKKCGNFGYGICPRSEGSPKNHICTNCCSGYKGCKYYSAEGTLICEGESDPRSSDDYCSYECDPQIAYSKCPHSSQGETRIEPTGCTTCCTGYTGCYYFNKDHDFVCEGETPQPNLPIALF